MGAKCFSMTGVMKTLIMHVHVWRARAVFPSGREEALLARSFMSKWRAAAPGDFAAFYVRVFTTVRQTFRRGYSLPTSFSEVKKKRRIRFLPLDVFSRKYHARVCVGRGVQLRCVCN